MPNACPRPATKLYSPGALRYPSATMPENGLSTRRLLCFCSSVSILSGSLACRSERPAAGAETPSTAAPGQAVVGNPFAGVTLYRAPYSNAENAQKSLEKGNPAEAALVAKIAREPQASWYGSWSGDIETVVENYVNAAERAGEIPLLVAYNVPNRDCGHYSAGGARDSETYREWISGFAAGIAARRAIVVLEPDALPLLAQCLSEADQAKRLDMMQQAVGILEAQPGVSVYIDAGHSNWVPAPEMASRLKRAGVEQARGFALNVSNYRADDELIKYGKDVIAELERQAPSGQHLDTHFIIDSSRNGNGPAPAADEDWCNPEGRALGRRPTAETGDPALDAFEWIKRPGESDGECKGGPAAGQWFAQRAVEMARNAKW
jgi:endoglucanase